jgi:hypothetical protein
MDADMQAADFEAKAVEQEVIAEMAREARKKRSALRKRRRARLKYNLYTRLKLNETTMPRRMFTASRLKDRKRENATMNDKPDVCFGDIVTSMSSEYCLTCKFYRADPDAWQAGDDLGRCHRFPPIAEYLETDLIGDTARYDHPRVTWVGYCGEWRRDVRSDPWKKPRFKPGYRLGKPIDAPEPIDPD